MLTLSVGVTFWEELTYRTVYCGCCSAGRKIWLWFGSMDEEGNRSTYFIYLFSVILPVHISWVRFFCTLFVRPWKLTAGLHQHSEVLRALRPCQSGEPVCSIPVVSFFISSLRLWLLIACPLSLSDRFPRAAGMSSDFTEVFEEELTFKRIPVWEQFSNCVLWNPGVPWGLSQGLRSFSLSPLPHHQVDQNSYTFIRQFLGEISLKKGFHCSYF